MSVTPDCQRAALGRIPTGVAVVAGVDTAGCPCGLTVGSFTSVSLSPPLVGFFVGAGSRSWRAMQPSARFSVNVLSTEQAQISGLFAGEVESRFDAVDWQMSENGLPRLAGVDTWIGCTLYSEQAAGDHVLVLGHVDAIERAGDAQAVLLYCERTYGRFSGL